MIVSSQGEKGGRELIDAFKRHFGLDIKLNADLSGNESQKFNQATVEAKSGIPPTFDLVQGEAANILQLKDAGGAEPIPNWEALLGEIAPEAYKVKNKVSPMGLTGYGFVWSTRTVALLYNTKLISERELPKTWKEMGDPKYRGAFSMPPWISALMMGLLKYDKGEWLEIVKSLGRNKTQVLNYAAGVERMLLGDLKFLYGNADYYYEHRRKDAKAPVGEAFFDDLTTMRETMYTVRKGARHPNAARLFALWATGAEAGAILDKYAVIENLVLGKGQTTEEILKALKSRNITPVSWFESPQNLEKFRWFSTNEGREYARAIAKAQREGK
jgi:ABC-type Fe3+ transport system substrate-binding protein